MTLAPAPAYWIDDAARTLAAGLPAKCWRCAVIVEANKVDLPGRCEAKPCPLDQASAKAKEAV